MKSCPVSAEVANIILKSIEAVSQLEAMTNYQIAKLLRDHVWSDIEVFSPKSDLVDEAIRRLERTP